MMMMIKMNVPMKTSIYCLKDTGENSMALLILLL